MNEVKSDFKSESEFEAMRTDFRADKTDIDLPREVARQFFLRIHSQEVKQTTGKSIGWMKAVVWLMNIASPIVFLVSLALIIMNYGHWEATLIVPVAGISWIVIYGLTSDQGGWLIGSIPLAISAIPLFETGQIANPLFFFVLSIWLQRTSYLLSAMWLLDIVMSSFDAFEMMEEHLLIDSD